MVSAPTSSREDLKWLLEVLPITMCLVGESGRVTREARLCDEVIVDDFDSYKRIRIMVKGEIVSVLACNGGRGVRAAPGDTLKIDFSADMAEIVYDLIDRGIFLES